MYWVLKGFFWKVFLNDYVPRDEEETRDVRQWGAFESRDRKQRLMRLVFSSFTDADEDEDDDGGRRLETEN